MLEKNPHKNRSTKYLRFLKYIIAAECVLFGSSYLVWRQMNYSRGESSRPLFVAQSPSRFFRLGNSGALQSAAHHHFCGVLSSLLPVHRRPSLPFLVFFLAVIVFLFGKFVAGYNKVRFFWAQGVGCCFLRPRGNFLFFFSCFRCRCGH